MSQIQLINTTVEIEGNPQDQYFSEIMTAGSFTEVYFPFISQFLADDAVCIDIGANIGMVSLALSSFCPNGTVYSFEPTPHLFTTLTNNIKANGRKNVVLNQLAVAEKKQTLTFFTVEHYPAGNFSLGDSIDDKQGEIFGKKTKVEAVSLDEWVKKNELKRLDFVKIDVEGAELRVLDGAKKTFAAFNPVVLMEFNSFAYITFQNITPTDAIKEIASHFEEVYVVNRTSGSLEKIEKTPAAQLQFVTANLRKGFVDDIVCLPKARNINIKRSKNAINPGLEEENAALRKQLQEKDELISRIIGSKRWKLISLLRGR